MYTALDILCSDITAICLKGEFSSCSIFNIYNDCTNNNTMTALCNYLTNNGPKALPTPSDHMLWLRDFNCHHPLWEPNNNHHLYNLADMINPLLDLITENNMIQALPPEIPTYEMAMSNWTHPDNIWCNNNPNDLIMICDINSSIRPPQADHLPILMELDLPVCRANKFPTHNMQDIDFKSINEKLKTLLAERCPASRINLKEELEQAVNTLVKTVQVVLDQEVPKSKDLMCLGCSCNHKV